ncbi:hypothetical protein SAMN05444366_4491 [Flavobacterium saccharophilum]|uniref:Uncharacterized protein n=1 Tax=Flavobacterium saccharophilum TaxID=29534 RepID=A0A1M7MD70_9FLAO|nr:hypothetical protein SAMN05444366_4491 [Flavobacterium saccharophilum]
MKGFILCRIPYGYFFVKMYIISYSSNVFCQFADTVIKFFISFKYIGYDVDTKNKI